MAINPITGLDDEELQQAAMMPNPMLDFSQYQQPKPLAAPQMDLSMMLQKLSGQPAISPEAQKSSQLRGLLAGMLSVPRAKYDLGGGITVGGETQRDVAESKRLQDWAGQPLEQEKQKREDLRKMIEDYAKVENIRSQGDARNALNEERGAKQDKLREDMAIRQQGTPQSSAVAKRAENDILDLAAVAEQQGRLDLADNLIKKADKAKDLSGEEARFEVKSAENMLSKDIGYYAAKTGRILGGGRLQLDTGKTEEARRDALRKVAIPGFDFFDIDNVMPDQQSAKAMRTAAVAAAKIHSTLNKMDKLVAEKGLSAQSYVGVGKDLNQYYQDLITQTKELDKLGALTGADIKIEQGKIPDPTAIINYPEGREKFRERLKEFSGLTIDTINQSAPILGYSPNRNLLDSIQKGAMSNLERSPVAIDNPTIKEANKSKSEKPSSPQLPPSPGKKRMTKTVMNQYMKAKGLTEQQVREQFKDLYDIEK